MFGVRIKEIWHVVGLSVQYVWRSLSRETMRRELPAALTTREDPLSTKRTIELFIEYGLCIPLCQLDKVKSFGIARLFNPDQERN